MRFLIVDDEATARKVLKKQLEIAHPSCQVVEADNGAVGLFHYFQEKPDLVLLDLMMPVVNGEMFLNVIDSCYQRGLIEEPRVVVITSFTDAEKLVALANRPSVETVIPKPITQATIDSLKSLL